MADLILGLDVGTTATKAIVVDPIVGLLAEASATTTLRSPHPGWAEEDPEEWRSEEHTSELQSQSNLVCRLLLEKKKKKTYERHFQQIAVHETVEFRDMERVTIRE